MSDELPVRLLYSADEFAAMVGKSKSTIMSLRLSEKWPYSKFGGSIMFSPEDIQEILRRSAQAPEPARTTRTRRTRR